MKRILFQTEALLLALYILFVSLGVNVNFHYCESDHHLTSSFGDASALCEHCLSHLHHHHTDEQAFEEHLLETHFGAKCCCEDFHGEIGFNDTFTFSTEKSQMVFLPSTLIAAKALIVLNDDLVQVTRSFAWETIPYLFTGRLKTIFFSSLKLNPLVF